MGNKQGFFSIFSKYLFTEVLFPLIFCVLGITIIFLGLSLFELTEMIVRKHIPVFVVVKILLYRLPEIFVLVFPISVLFAVVFALGRLAKDNEITIMRISGFGIHRILLPFLVLGILISFATYWINEEVAPWASHRSMNLVRKYIIKDVTPVIKENVFMKGPDDRHFFVRQVDLANQTLYDIVIYEMKYEDKKSSFPRVIVAKKGLFKDTTWELEDGITHEFDESGFIKRETRFNSLSVPVTDGLENFYGSQKTTSEMSRDELHEDIQLFLKSGIQVDSWVVDYHRKMAVSFVPFIFVLIAAPLSIRNRKGWVISIIFALVIAFAYFVVEALFRSLGGVGAIDAFLAAWLPCWIFGVLGIILIIREEFFILG